MKNQEEPPLSIIHRFAPAFEWAIALGIPAIVLVVGHISEGAKMRLEYVRLAIGVLQPPDKDHQPQKELRSWAVEILQNSSPVKLSTTAAQALIDGEANFGSTYSDYGYSSPIKSAKPEPKAKSQ